MTGLKEGLTGRGRYMEQDSDEEDVVDEDGPGDEPADGRGTEVGGPEEEEPDVNGRTRDQLLNK